MDLWWTVIVIRLVPLSHHAGNEISRLYSCRAMSQHVCAIVHRTSRSPSVAGSGGGYNLVPSMVTDPNLLVLNVLGFEQIRTRMKISDESMMGMAATVVRWMVVVSVPFLDLPHGT